jgi:hypothetical protein
MSQVSFSFFTGFFVAGFIGWLSTLLLKSWNTIQRTQRQMFENPPQPALKPLPGIQGISGVGAVPNQSPLQVLISGCTTILMHLFLLLSSFLLMGTLFWFTPREDVSSSFFGGIFFAAIVGVLLQNIRFNFKRIVVVYNMMIRPPVPTLNFVNPPNRHNLAAFPSFPPFTVILNGLVEIGLRFIWIIALFYFLYLAISVVYSYLSEGDIVGVFEV